MNVIVCERPGQFRHTVLPAPDSPAPGEAIVRIRRVGVCGTDYHAFAGRQPFFSYPRILGHELAGTVMAVGPQPESSDSGIKDAVRTGDQVCILPYLNCGRCVACRNGKPNCCANLQVLGVHTDGGMRDLISVPVSHLMPANDLTLDQTVIVEPLAIGAHAVRRSELKPGDIALVIGAGPIGLGVMAFAKRRGAGVIAMDLNRERLAFCRIWAGADETVSAGEGAADRVMALTGGDGPAVVFDATGNARSMAESFRFVAPGGRLVFVGLVQGEIAFSDPEFHRREMTLLASRNATREDFAMVMDALRGGSLDAGRYITHRASRTDAADQWNEWQKPSSGVIKAIVEWD
jgi:2-desacetyl-2-hydroxyethyl bacteriochlorophyllide A dehydrogenase